jgi:hydroxymethylpyrimidine/phosphomethylpyrimidine kinase
VGLLADVEAVKAAAALPYAAPTALTDQTAKSELTSVPPRFVIAQLRALVSEGVNAVKVGMVPSRLSLRAVQAGLADARLPWVVDPITHSSRHFLLSTLQPGDFLALASPLTFLTPNALEAGWLLGRAPPRTPPEAERAARELCARGFGGIVVKGGHLRGAPVDVVAWDKDVTLLRRPVRRPHRWRGTGCRLASFLAAKLAQGESFPHAARLAHAYLGRLFREPPPWAK